ncbi:peroxisomal membrane protein PEX14-like isoform X2 [Panicum miliaceum]|uniref:Peroxisomal membrane protein PEX14 n=1 Tax=Panicum miliaceum TaxID=4540 RepID=A0A3L6SVW6_PANMI|nr:peroxisomal membrane protein PEX14-like isoform X2 [Panicum miliaceum]
MADLSTFADGEVAEEAKRQAPGQGSSEGSDGTILQDTREREIRKGKAAVVSTELMREDLVQSAVSFLKHPKVVISSDGQRRSFLENKGLTVDEIDEAFRRLQSPSSRSLSSNTCTSQERVEPETEPVVPVVPRHPKSYMEDINDDPPNPDQPISEPRMAPKPKPWEKHAQESSAWDLKSPSSDSSELRSEVQQDNANKATKSADSSHQGDSLLPEEVAAGSESPTDAAATS